MNYDIRYLPLAEGILVIVIRVHCFMINRYDNMLTSCNLLSVVLE